MHTKQGKNEQRKGSLSRGSPLFHSSSRVDVCVCAGIERAAQSDIAASPGANHALTHLICECVCAQMCWKIVRVPSLSAADAESISLFLSYSPAVCFQHAGERARA